MTVADSQATYDILSRRIEFIKPAAMYSIESIVIVAVSYTNENIE